MTKRRRLRRSSRSRTRLSGLDLDGLSRSEVPTALPTEEEPSNLAFCPLLVKYAGKGYCGRVACRDCDYPRREYEDLETTWLCTICAEEAEQILPYHGDGKCRWCGFESSVLMLCEVPDG